MICSPSASAGSKEFLVVEPDPLFRLLLCVAVADQFTDFHAVATFSEARTLLSQHIFAAIIAEYHLPGGSGLKLHEEVRRTTPDVPFILMCGGTSITLSDPYFRFLAKPFGVADFAGVLANMMTPQTDLPCAS